GRLGKGRLCSQRDLCVADGGSAEGCGHPGTGPPGRRVRQPRLPLCEPQGRAGPGAGPRRSPAVAGGHDRLWFVVIV
ncbi:MAG: hypothetical protein AVDCRST_MAG78-2216, partial [uncultured Rubrobacteraceae bacterium]